MSFSIIVTCAPEDATATVRGAAETYFGAFADDAFAKSEMEAAADLGAKVAGELAREVAPNAEQVTVDVTGHCNPDHKAAAGWANDGVTVRVNVVSYIEDSPVDAVEGETSVSEEA